MSTSATSSTHTLGEPLELHSGWPQTPRLVVFEDDGQTGYFYALDLEQEDQPIRDALHVYDVAPEQGVTKRLDVRWVMQGARVGLFVDDVPMAVFDFVRKQGWARSGHPPASGTSEWSPDGHMWDVSILEVFRDEGGGG